MHIITLLIVLTKFHAYSCHENINKLFEEINENTIKFNKIASEIAWTSSIKPDEVNLLEKSAKYQENRIIWQDHVCDRLATLNGHLINSTQRRMTYLLCRGPKFSFKEARYLNSLYNQLQSTYSSYSVCLPSDNQSKSNPELEESIFKYLENKTEFSNKVVCLAGEMDFENLMCYSNKEPVLKWLWNNWREIGTGMKRNYKELVRIENMAARRNGYTDIGEVWRDELEITNVRYLCRHLYHRVKPLYRLLHGVVRFFLRKHYGDIVPESGLIPAHLLGDLWSQSWDSLIDIMSPQTIDLNESIRQANWTVIHMVKLAEDFYQSLGLPAMTESFWRESVFKRQTDSTRCHGAAADMFQNGDYRLIYCSGTTMQDFYVIHHELGHIQYYMAYEDQPGLFRQANSALHESIGDAIMYGVMAPQHLHRVGLINDSVLFNNTVPKHNDDNYFESTGLNEAIENDINKDKQDDSNENTNQNELNKGDTKLDDKIEPKIIDPTITLQFESTDDIVMLKQALNKIPQIPFSLIIDEYRWKYFEDGIDEGTENTVFWNMVEEFSGIAPPDARSEEYFDVAAKFHVPDNTPYIRYFLSSFLQHQIFEKLCKAAVFGRRDVDEDLPDTITLNRCDIYGSKTVGKIMKDLMEQGHSQHWRKILESSIGIEDISASSLLRYYRPLQKLLENFVKKYDIPIDW